MVARRQEDQIIQTETLPKNNIIPLYSEAANNTHTRDIHSSNDSMPRLKFNDLVDLSSVSTLIDFIGASEDGDSELLSQVGFSTAPYVLAIDVEKAKSIKNPVLKGLIEYLLQVNFNKNSKYIHINLTQESFRDLMKFSKEPSKYPRAFFRIYKQGSSIRFFSTLDKLVWYSNRYSREMLVNASSELRHQVYKGALRIGTPEFGEAYFNDIETRKKRNAMVISLGGGTVASSIIPLLSQGIKRSIVYELEGEIIKEHNLRMYGATAEDIGKTKQEFLFEKVVSSNPLSNIEMRGAFDVHDKVKMKVLFNTIENQVLQEKHCIIVIALDDFEQRIVFHFAMNAYMDSLTKDNQELFKRYFLILSPTDIAPDGVLIQMNTFDKRLNISLEELAQENKPKLLVKLLGGPSIIEKFPPEIKEAVLQYGFGLGGDSAKPFPQNEPIIAAAVIKKLVLDYISKGKIVETQYFSVGEMLIQQKDEAIAEQ